MRSKRGWGLLVCLALACGEPRGPTESTASRKRLFHFANGALGKIRDANDPRSPLDVADAKCTDEAVARGLGGTWRAWLSSSTENAIDRIADVGPWYRLDQTTLVFAGRADLRNGPRAPINATPSARNRFWSGSLLDGTRSADRCNDWEAYDFPLKGTIGNADATGTDWVEPAPLDCGSYLALLCFEQGP